MTVHALTKITINGVEHVVTSRFIYFADVVYAAGFRERYHEGSFTVRYVAEDGLEAALDRDGPGVPTEAGLTFTVVEQPRTRSKSNGRV